jgi:hypothetical protein
LIFHTPLFFSPVSIRFFPSAYQCPQASHTPSASPSLSLSLSLTACLTVSVFRNEISALYTRSQVAVTRSVGGKGTKMLSGSMRLSHIRRDKSSTTQARSQVAANRWGRFGREFEEAVLSFMRIGRWDLLQQYIEQKHQSLLAGERTAASLVGTCDRFHASTKAYQRYA